MKQYSNTGGITMSMLLVTLYQGFYVWDALYQEVSNLNIPGVRSGNLTFPLSPMNLESNSYYYGHYH